MAKGVKALDPLAWDKMQRTCPSNSKPTPDLSCSSPRHSRDLSNRQAGPVFPWASFVLYAWADLYGVFVTILQTAERPRFQ